MKDSSYIKITWRERNNEQYIFYSQCKLRCFNHIKPEKICVWAFMIYDVKVVVKKVYFISERRVRASLRDFLKSHRVSEGKKKNNHLHRFKVCS